MILAQEATRIEIPNDAANVVDLVQGRRYEIYRVRRSILKLNLKVIVCAWKVMKK